MVLLEGTMEKSPVTPPGIDPGTVRLVAQRLNHYATPGPGLHVKFPLFLPDFNQILIFWTFFEKYSNINFRENPSS
jgi:hypothetical protein